MVSWRGLTVALIGLIFLTAQVGCGGDDESDSEANGGSAAQSTSGSEGASGDGGDGAVETSGLTKAQFIKRAGAICAETEPRVIERAEQLEGQPDSEVTGNEAERVEALNDAVLVPTMQETIDEIRKLGAPQGEAEEVEAILAAMQEAVEAAEGDQITSYIQFGEEFEDSDRLAVQYGLKDCTFSF